MKNKKYVSIPDMSRKHFEYLLCMAQKAELSNEQIDVLCSFLFKTNSNFNKEAFKKDMEYIDYELKQ
jgi:hypothetical protein